MSIGPSKKALQWQKTKLSSHIDGKRIIEKVGQRVREDMLGALTLFCIVVTAVGYLAGRGFNGYWHFINLLVFVCYIRREELYNRKQNFDTNIKDVRDSK